MAAASHPEYNDKTEALEVASAFADEIRGKTVIITGVNPGGIGFSTAEAFASQAPARLIIVGRSESKVKQSIDALKAKLPAVDYRPLLMDLSSQKSVRAAASQLLSWSDTPTIDIVVNSAGVMMLPERILNEDGIEMHFATNHIGHFLFTCLIMPKLIKAAEGARKGATRIVNVSSLSPLYAAMRWSDTNFDKVNKELPEAEQPAYDLFKSMFFIENPEGRSYIPLEGYNQSKVANVLFGVAANKRLYDRFGILSLSLHPGIIDTELGRNASPDVLAVFESMKQAGQFRGLGAGASTSLVAATDPKLGVEGKACGVLFLTDCQVHDESDFRAITNDEAEKLWQFSEELVKEKFDWK